ncbi:NfeD family protein [Calderihabitans maritimus]|uniref:Uncharacterized protein n=1 Tax=Calderihabitans maritimus TaxID=1246530 RepID=A0A1Z5HP19_9FIRM|nr:NfeD family protein [Calderihabitans maritimus]GAW91279.1 hypothetical protein TherJR_2428 [Calderihabitans maritimus]
MANPTKRPGLKLLAWQMLIFLFLVTAPSTLGLPKNLIYVVPVRGTIDSGLARFMERAFLEAEQAQAAAVLLEIDTPGGRIDAALKIRDVIEDSPLETIAFVTGGAISAGSLVALSADHLIMQPGATIGDAEPRIGTAKADEKVISYWAAQLAAAAEKHGRNPQVAAAMADADITIPGVIDRGKLLTLTATRARELGIADAVLPDRQAVLKQFNLQDGQLVELNLSDAERLARWVTNPLVSTILLTVGLAGLVIEIFTVGFGIPGTIGLISLALYFGGHILAGLTGWEAVVLLIVGLVLLAMEITVIPGFGFAGLGGIAALAASILLAAPSPQQGLLSLLIALAGTVVLLVLSLRFLPTRRVWNRLILATKQDKTTGYVAPSAELSNYLGLTGRSVTPLRPAGIMELPDGNRLDVVAEGSFIPPNTTVKVVKVEGSRVIVRPYRE